MQRADVGGRDRTLPKVLAGVRRAATPLQPVVAPTSREQYGECSGNEATDEHALFRHAQAVPRVAHGHADEFQGAGFSTVFQSRVVRYVRNCSATCTMSSVVFGLRNSYKCGKRCIERTSSQSASASSPSGAGTTTG